MKKLGITQQIIILISGMVLITALSIGLWSSYLLYNQLVEKEETRLSVDAEFAGSQFMAESQAIINDVKFLSNTASLKGFVRAYTGGGTDLKDGLTVQYWRKQLIKNFIEFTKAKPSYLQVRLIGIADNGRELIRVGRNKDNGQVINVPEYQLQEKGDSSYFINTLKLLPGEIYLSDIELNVEFGKVQLPYMPVIRAAMPVYTINNELFGIIVINLNINTIFAELAGLLKNGREVYLLSNVNNYKMQTKPDSSIGFEFQPVINLHSSFPNITKTLTTSMDNHGILKNIGIEKSMTVGFKKINFDPGKRNRYAVIIMAASNDNVVASAQTSLKISIMVTLLLLPIILLLGSYISHTMTRPLRQIVESVLAFANDEPDLPLPLEAGGEAGVLAHAIDNMRTQVQERSALLEESELRYRTVVDSTVDGIITINQQAQIITFNQAAEKIFGYSEDEVLGHNVNMLMPEPYRSGNDSYINSYTETGVAQIDNTGREVEGMCKDGKTFPMNLAMNIMKLGEQCMFVCIVSDLTKRKQIETDLIQAKDQAEAANRAKASFLASMSHELRTPLNAIIGYSEMLREDAESQEHEEIIPDLQKIHQAGRHLLNLISDVLDLSRIEAGKMNISVENVNIVELTEEVRTTILPLAQEKGNTLTVTLADDVTTMRTDPTRLRQCLLNLLSNAAKFTENGQIKLQVSHMTDGGSKWIAFQVSDTGIGLSIRQMQQIFGAFAQAETTTAVKYGGAGLGLAIIRELSQLMGGDINVASELGKGSTFTLRIPDSIKKVVAKTRVNEPNHKVEQHKPSTSDDKLPLVLVIDDEKEAREILSWHLAKQGYRLITATSGAEGLELARDLQPKIITLDVLMPEMDGWHVLEALKADPAVAHIPVIMCTIVDSQEYGFALGATDYLTKPVDRKRLMQILQKFCTASHCRVLLVDDDPVSREMMVRTLMKAGWEVIEADNGRVALARLEEQQPEAILLDLMMPEMDGFEFITKVQQHEEWRDIPVVVVTAKDLKEEDHLRLNGYVASVIDKKEYRMEDLLEIVTLQLGRKVKSQPNNE